MFTGFASENTPAIQVWEYMRAQASTFASRIVSLADDCAPIQYFKTGGTANYTINLYLPSCPIEGKQIKIINSKFAANKQSIAVYSSDATYQYDSGTNIVLYTIGPGQTLDLCYSKNFISFGPTIGQYASGWIALNQSPAVASNSYAVSFGNNNSATNVSSAVVGGSNNTATNDSSSVIGGNANNATAQNSFVGGGQSGNASNTSAAVVGGSSNTSAGDSCVVLGGTNNQAVSSGSWSLIAAGTNNYISANSCGILAGQSNTTSGDMSVVSGGRQGTTRSIIGYTVSPASSIPISNISGVNQTALLVLARQTTDATATVIRSNGAAAGTTNQVILPNNSAYTFQGTCIANVTGGSTTSGWKFEGVIKRGANAASTTLVAAVTPTVIAQDALATTWVLAITADTTNGGIKVEVTGAAATTIRWVSKIETTEVTF